MTRATILSMLTEPQLDLLRKMSSGYLLRDHRDIDGAKSYTLHAMDNSVESVSVETIEALIDAGLIDSNKKFPSATYWLTQDGSTRALIGYPSVPSVDQESDDVEKSDS
jgi:hypothetical protein